MAKQDPTRRTFIKAAGAATVAAFTGPAHLAAQPAPRAPFPGSLDRLLVGHDSLFRPTAGGCTIHWIPRAPVEARISAGPAPHELAVRNKMTTDRPTEVVVDGFEPDSEYWVQTSFRRAGSTDWVDQSARRVRTARQPGAKFQVALIADSHVYYAIRSPQHMRNLKRTVERVLQDQPDFVIFLGDEGGVAAHRFDHPTFMNQQRAIERWSIWRRAFAPLLAAVPSYMVLGNHEGEAGYYQALAYGGRVHHYQRWATIARKNTCLGPLPNTYAQGGEDQGWAGGNDREATGGKQEGNCSPLQNYYAWTWGDALFIVLDVHRYTNVGGRTPRTVEEWSLGPAQMRWFEKVLSSSTARWKVVVAHHLVGGAAWDRFGAAKKTDYVYGRGGARYARIGEQAHITGLMQRTGAQFFLYGHDHVFAHQQAGEIHFVCCGRPTWLSSTWWGNPGWREAYGDAAVRNPNDFYAALGYTRLSLSPEGVKVEYVRTGTDANHAENVAEPEGQIVNAFSVT